MGASYEAIGKAAIMRLEFPVGSVTRKEGNEQVHGLNPGKWGAAGVASPASDAWVARVEAEVAAKAASRK